MPFKGNKSDEQIVAVKKLFTGVASWSILAINPNEKEREALGITQKIGDYIGTDKNQNKQIRLDIWLKLVKVPFPVKDLNRKDIQALPPQKLTFFITDKEIVSKNDNTMKINKVGRCTFLTADAIEANPKMKWFDTDGLRPVFPGEEQLTKFLIALLNVDITGEGAECRLLEPKKLAGGSLKELKEILKGWEGNTVQAMLLLKKEGKSKFPDFFKEFFGRTTPGVNTVDLWKNAIEDTNNGLDSNAYTKHTGTIVFQEYVPDANIDSSYNAGGSDGGGSSGAPDMAGGYPEADEEEDVPF